jgi:hypothetical protein
VITGTPGDDQFVIRLAAGDPTTVELSDNGGKTFTDVKLSTIASIEVVALSGHDTLTIDDTNGLVGTKAGLPIVFQGGRNVDTLVITGPPTSQGSQPTIVETFSALGKTGYATMTFTDNTVSSTLSLQAIDHVVDLLPAATLTINATPFNDTIFVREGPVLSGVQTMIIRGNDTHGLQSATNTGNAALKADTDDLALKTYTAFQPITFAHKTNVVVNGLAGDDLFDLNFTKSAAGLQTLTLDGGTGTNQVIEHAVPKDLTIILKNIKGHLTSADEVFIQSLYVDRLGRMGLQSELDGWKSVLASQGNLAVVKGIEESLESRDGIVRSLYEKFLGRTPQNGEENPWVQSLMHGASQEQVTAGILASAEFQRDAEFQGGTLSPDRSYVTSLYQMLLNRAPSTAEVTGWVNAMQSAGRSAVVLGFMGSGEFRTNMVMTFYTGLLHRNGEAAGVSAWVASGMTASQVREGFASSGEFYNNA